MAEGGETSQVNIDREMSGQNKQDGGNRDYNVSSWVNFIMHSVK